MHYGSLLALDVEQSRKESNTKKAFVYCIDNFQDETNPDKTNNNNKLKTVAHITAVLQQFQMNNYRFRSATWN